MVDADLAEFVDDNGDAAAMVRGQHSVEERRFARSEKPAQDDDGGFLGSAPGSTVMALVEAWRIAVPWVVSLGGAIKAWITSRPPRQNKIPAAGPFAKCRGEPSCARFDGGSVN